MDKQQRIEVKHIIAKKARSATFTCIRLEILLITQYRAKQTILLGNVNKGLMCDIQNMKNITQYSMTLQYLLLTYQQVYWS